MDVRYSSLALVIVLFGAGARAQEGRPYRLVYSAPAQCPDRAAFSSLVQSNSARVRHALAGEAAATVDARVAASNGEFEGALRILDSEGAQTIRAVSGSSCVEAVEAMALIVTLTLDPDAQEPALFEEAAEPAAEGLPPTPYDSVNPGAAVAAAPTIGVDAPPTRRPKRGSDEGSWPLVPRASIGVVSANGPAASVEYGGGVGVMTSPSPMATLLALSVHSAVNTSSSFEWGTARFTRVVVRTSACPALDDNGVLVLRACVGLGFGQLMVDGGETTVSAISHFPWLELGGRIRGEVRVFGPLIVGTEVGTAFHLLRDVYVTAIGAEVFEVPPFGVSAAIDLGLQI